MRLRDIKNILAQCLKRLISVGKYKTEATMSNRLQQFQNQKNRQTQFLLGGFFIFEMTKGGGHQANELGQYEVEKHEWECAGYC